MTKQPRFLCATDSHRHGASTKKSAPSRTPDEFADPALTPFLQNLQDVLRIYARGDELRAVLHHRGEHPFSVQVDERHAAYVHYALAASILTVRLFPIRFQLRDPGPREPALQRPSLFLGLVGDRDSQHCVLRSRCEIAHGMPFSELEVKFSKDDGATGDGANRENQAEGTCQCATARFVALCRLPGTEKM